MEQLKNKKGDLKKNEQQGFTIILFEFLFLIVEIIFILLLTDL